jgi:hypothetical protein
MARAAREQGIELHPFILALPGTEMFETDALLDEVLALELPHLRWIALEYGKWDPEVIERNFDSNRLTWWQSPLRTGLLMRIAWAEASDDGDRDDALPLIARAALKLAMNYSRIAQRSKEDRVENQSMREARREAYSAAKLNRDFEADYRKKLQKHRERRQVNEGWSVDEEENERYDAVTAHAFAGQIARIQAAGAEPLYIVPPSLIRKGVRPETTVLDFDDPEAYPEFFKPGNRIDAGHLAESQLEAYGKLVCERLSDLMKS